MVEPPYVKAPKVIFIHAKFKNYFFRTELLFGLANHLNGFLILRRKFRLPRLFWIKMRTDSKLL